MVINVWHIYLHLYKCRTVSLALLTLLHLRGMLLVVSAHLVSRTSLSFFYLSFFLSFFFFLPSFFLSISFFSFLHSFFSFLFFLLLSLHLFSWTLLAVSASDITIEFSGTKGTGLRSSRAIKFLLKTRPLQNQQIKNPSHLNSPFLKCFSLLEEFIVSFTSPYSTFTHQGPVVQS